MKFIHLLALLPFLVQLSVHECYAQKEVDSLIALSKKMPDDTAKLHVLNSIAELSADDDVWPIYNQQMAKLSLVLMKSSVPQIKKRAMYHFANSQINTGYLHNSNGDLDSSIFYYQQALTTMQELGDKSGMAAALNNIGYAFKSQGDILSALDCYHRSLKLYESIKYDKGIANTLNNLAIIYGKQGDVKTSIEYNKKSLAISERMGDKRSVAISLNNIALLYHKRNKPEQAIADLNKALKIQNEIGDIDGIANSYNNIGYVYEENGKLQPALDNYLFAYNMALKGSDKPVFVSTAINVATIYLKLNKTKEAFLYANEAYKLAKEIAFVNELADASDLMSQIFKKKGDYKNALEMHEVYVKLKDSALNESTRKASLQMKYQYAYEKKAIADSIKNQEFQKVKDAQIAAQNSALKQEKTMKYVSFFGLALFIIISIYAYYRYRDTKKKNAIIAFQKEIVDQKQKEMIDSIVYAKRIQQSLLPTEKYIEKVLEEHKKKAKK